MGWGVAPPAQLAPPSPLLAEQIDPETGDYISLFDGVDPIEAQVLNALRIRRGSGASVMDVGNRFHLIRKIDETIGKQIDSLTREALGRLIANRDIRYLGIDVEVLDPGNSTVVVKARWQNLRAMDGQARSTPIPLGH